MFLQVSVCPQWECLPHCMLGYTLPPGRDIPCLDRHTQPPPPTDTPLDPGQTYTPLDPGQTYTPPLDRDLPDRHPPPPRQTHTPPDRYPPGQTPAPRTDTLPWTDTPLDRPPPIETATAADGTHPTGMHSC